VLNSPSLYVQIDDARGKVMDRSATLQDDSLPPPRRDIGASGSFDVVTVGGNRVRVHTRPLFYHGQLVGYIQVGRPLSLETDALATLTAILIVVGLAAILISSVVAWLVAGSALKPLAAMTRVARAIARSRRFGDRLPQPGSRDELAVLAAAFNEVLTSLDKAHTAQQRFLADASHELRTPLTALEANLGYLTMARRAPAPEREEAFLAARREVKRMGRLVNELLYLARHDAGQQMERRPVELDQVVVAAYREIKPLANGVATSLSSLDEAVVLGDPDRLEQVVLILLDNALKYTPPGGSVSVALEAQDGQAAVSVSDTGPGMAEDELPHIFDRFYRSPRSEQRYREGSGLGLAIAKQIVESHDGCIEVQSAPGQGSVFTVSLPLAASY
jgi:signal transduction histidine kinase